MLKKFLTGILTVALSAAALCGAVACDDHDDDDDRGGSAQNGGGQNGGGQNGGGQNGGNGSFDLPDLEVFAPDGAPALALANAIAKEEEREDDVFDFTIVNSETIIKYVTGSAPEADLCILPANAAAKTLGTGAVYRMLGTVTNGNLYFLTTGENPTLTAENLKTATSGKKIGVVQLLNVPGLTLQAVLKEYGVKYRVAQSAEETVSEGTVNLIPFSPNDVTPAGKCDYYLCPEPAASTKIAGTASTVNPFRAAGDLQALYGEDGGYPQAVAVAKESVIRNRPEDVSRFVGYLSGSEAFLESASPAAVAGLVAEELEDGLTPTLNAKNLTKEVIRNCSVRFTASKDCKDKVIGFLQKLIEVNESAAAIPADEFFSME